MNAMIRQENKADFEAIFEINNLAFGQENEAKLVDLLRNSDAFIPELSLVAIVDNRVIGHILFSRIKIIDEHQHVTGSISLAPVSVLPEFQHKGIGKQLIETGLNIARELNYKSVIVLGHEHYYPKFGFLPAAKWNIKAPFDVASNACMALELTSEGLKNINGTVKYPKEFEAV